MPAVVESSSIHHALIIILYLSASTFLPVSINTVSLSSTAIFPLRMAARAPVERMFDGNLVDRFILASTLVYNGLCVLVFLFRGLDMEAWERRVGPPSARC